MVAVGLNVLEMAAQIYFSWTTGREGLSEKSPQERGGVASWAKAIEDEQY